MITLTSSIIVISGPWFFIIKIKNLRYQKNWRKISKIIRKNIQIYTPKKTHIHKNFTKCSSKNRKILSEKKITEIRALKKEKKEKNC
jgi:predicted double-glycine peptidase